MPVMSVFGMNLRQLCARRGAQADAARLLGMSRAQFQRFLRGEAFPRPDQLKALCGHFGVDARILTEPLTDRLLQNMRGGPAPVRHDGAEGMAEAVAFACPTQRYFGVAPEFPDGLYLMWRLSMSQLDRVAATLVHVRTLAHSRVVRGFDLRSIYHGQSIGRNPASREYRGILHRQQVGFSVICYHADPVRVISDTFLQPVPTGKGGQMLIGFTVLGRGEQQGMIRMSRCVWQRVEPTWPAAMAAARRQGLMAPADVPPSVWTILSEPLR